MLLGVEPEVCGATRMGHGISIVTMRSRDPVSNPGYRVRSLDNLCFHLAYSTQHEYQRKLNCRCINKTDISLMPAILRQASALSVQRNKHERV